VEKGSDEKPRISRVMNYKKGTGGNEVSTGGFEPGGLPRRCRTRRGNKFFPCGCPERTARADREKESTGKERTPSRAAKKGPVHRDILGTLSRLGKRTRGEREKCGLHKGNNQQGFEFQGKRRAWDATKKRGGSSGSA